MWVLLKDSNPYFREFRRKSRKTQNGQVDRELNFAPSVYQFLTQNLSATGGAMEIGALVQKLWLKKLKKDFGIAL